MSMLSKTLKIVMGIILVTQAYAYITQTPVFLSFTLSNSMEPTIMTGDFFLLSPKIIEQKILVGDIIVFKDPNYLRTNPICHRVIANTEKGYITRGDNSPFTDQEGNIPIIKDENIIGKVITFNSNPILIPKLGLALIQMQYNINANKIPFALFFLAAGIGIYRLDTKYNVKYKKVKEIRIKEKYILIASILLLIVFSTSTMLLKCRELDVKYLAATSFTSGDAIKIGDTSERNILVENTGLIPVYLYMKPISQGSSNLDETFTYLNYQESYDYLIKLRPEGPPGWRNEKMAIYLYPALLPENIIRQLAAGNPYLPIATIVIMITTPILFIYTSIEDEKTIRIKMKTPALRLIGGIKR